MPSLAKYFLFAVALAASAQTPNHEVINLYPDGAPGVKGTAAEDIPTLTLYPTKSNTAVVVCPGGGYVHLAMSYEGYEVAEWLNMHGISAVVLKYRLGPKYHYPAQLDDAQQAIRWVRTHYSGQKVGIWGFSAGGHLASTAGTHFHADDRPDFMILAYPVITMMTPGTHQGSLHALLGNNPDPELVKLLSNELQVTTQTPPTFLFATTEDQVVPVENSVNFYLALRKAGVPVEMHIYQKGHHGVGLAFNDPILSTWPGHLLDWLKVNNLQ